MLRRLRSAYVRGLYRPGPQWRKAASISMLVLSTIPMLALADCVDGAGYPGCSSTSTSAGSTCSDGGSCSWQCYGVMSVTGPGSTETIGGQCCCIVPTVCTSTPSITGHDRGACL